MQLNIAICGPKGTLGCRLGAGEIIHRSLAGFGVFLTIGLLLLFSRLYFQPNPFAKSVITSSIQKRDLDLFFIKFFLPFLHILLPAATPTFCLVTFFLQLLLEILSPRSYFPKLQAFTLKLLVFRLWIAAAALALQLTGSKSQGDLELSSIILLGVPLVYFVASKARHSQETKALTVSIETETNRFFLKTYITKLVFSIENYENTNNLNFFKILLRKHLISCNLDFEQDCICGAILADPSSATRQLWFSFITLGLRRASARHPNFLSPMFLEVYMYLSKIGNVWQSLGVFIKLETKKLSLQQNFSLYMIKQLIEEKLRFKNSFNDKLIRKVIAFEELKVAFLLRLRSIAELKITFFTDLMQEKPAFSRLRHQMERMLHLDYPVDKLYSSMIKLSEGNISLISTFASYCVSIRSDFKRAKSLYKRLAYTINSREMRQKNLGFQETDNFPLIVLSAEKSTMGLIESVNKEATELFNYEREEMINKDISNFMPKFYGERHHQFLQNFLVDGVCRMIGIQRGLVILKKSGFVQQCELRSNVLPLLKAGLRCVGIFYKLERGRLSGEQRKFLLIFDERFGDIEYCCEDSKEYLGLESGQNLEPSSFKQNLSLNKICPELLAPKNELLRWNGISVEFDTLCLLDSKRELKESLLDDEEENELFVNENIEVSFRKKKDYIKENEDFLIEIKDPTEKNSIEDSQNSSVQKKNPQQFLGQRSPGKRKSLRRKSYVENPIGVKKKEIVIEEKKDLDIVKQYIPPEIINKKKKEFSFSITDFEKKTNLYGVNNFRAQVYHQEIFENGQVFTFVHLQKYNPQSEREDHEVYFSPMKIEQDVVSPNRTFKSPNKSNKTTKTSLRTKNTNTLEIDKIRRSKIKKRARYFLSRVNITFFFMTVFVVFFFLYKMIHSVQFLETQSAAEKGNYASLGIIPYASKIIYYAQRAKLIAAGRLRPAIDKNSDYKEIIIKLSEQLNKIRNEEFEFEGLRYNLTKKTKHDFSIEYSTQLRNGQIQKKKLSFEEAFRQFERASASVELSKISELNTEQSIWTIGKKGLFEIERNGLQRIIPGMKHAADEFLYGIIKKSKTTFFNIFLLILELVVTLGLILILVPMILHLLKISEANVMSLLFLSEFHLEKIIKSGKKFLFENFDESELSKNLLEEKLKEEQKLKFELEIYHKSSNQKIDFIDPGPVESQNIKNNEQLEEMKKICQNFPARKSNKRKTVQIKEKNNFLPKRGKTINYQNSVISAEVDYLPESQINPSQESNKGLRKGSKDEYCLGGEEIKMDLDSPSKLINPNRQRSIFSKRNSFTVIFSFK